MKEKTKELKGIGGWLLFFVILQSLGIFSIINNSSSKIEVPTILWLDLVRIIFIIIGLVMIFKEKRKAISWNIFILWISFVVIIINFLLNYESFSSYLQQLGINNSFTLLFIIFSVVFNFILTTIWTLYFKWSKRVRNTLIN